MVRMILQNGECAVDLLHQHHARQRARQRPLPQRQHKGGLPPRIIGEPVAPANRKQQRDRVQLFALQHRRQLLGRILFPPRIKQHQLVLFASASALTHAARQCQNRRFISCRDTLHFGIVRNPFQIFIRQTLDCRLFRLSDPRHFDLHRPRAHALPDASTTSAPNRISSPTRYRSLPAFASARIVGHISSGTRSSIGRKGAAVAQAYSKTSSASPGHVHGRLRVVSSTSPNPAALITSESEPAAENRKGSAPPSGSSAPPTCRCTI